MLALLACSSFVSSRSVLFCLSHSGMKIHECVQGHVDKLRMHHDGSGLCVISYYCYPHHMNATTSTSSLVPVFVEDLEDPS